MILSTLQWGNLQVLIFYKPLSLVTSLRTLYNFIYLYSSTSDVNYYYKRYMDNKAITLFFDSV